MFELTRDVIDDIIFAMEDQEGAWQVELQKGGLVARELACGDGESVVSLPRMETVSIPAWSPREGFKLMESFVVGLRNAEARKALLSALGQGRGVFKAFKEKLSAYPEAERAFRDRKARVMGRRIREWYDELRVAAGLERVGLPAEDTEDLIESDLGHSVGLASAARPYLLGLVDGLADELAAEFPAAYAASEGAGIRARLAREDWVGLWIDDGEGGAIAGAAGRRESGPGYTLGRIFMVAVAPGFRRQGLARSLVEMLAEELGNAQGLPILVDCPFLIPEFEEALVGSGFVSLGTRAWRSS